MRNLWKTGVIGIAALLALLTGVMLLWADPGDLDLTFGNGTGYVTTDIDNTYDNGGGMVIDSTGRIVVTDDMYSGIDGSFYGVIIRYNPDGQIDTTFGDNGKIIVDPSPTNLRAIELDSTERIVIAVVNSFSGAMLKRYNPDGTPDLTFGNQGTVLNPDLSGFSALSIGTGGKIMVVACCVVVGGVQHLSILRYKADGTPDLSFGNQGSVGAEIFGTIASILPNADGSFVAVGYNYLPSQENDIVLAKYADTGALDPDFGDNGVVITDLYERDYASDAVRDQNGNIIVTGIAINFQNEWYDALSVLRYLPDGTLDSAFGDHGVVITEAPNGCEGSAITIDDTGNIVVAGVAWGDDETNQLDGTALIARYHSDGTLDSTFGDGDGQVLLLFDPAAYSWASDVALDSTDRIVIAGTIQGVDFDSNILIARFQTDFSIPETPSPTNSDTPLPTQTPGETATPEPTMTSTATTPAGVNLSVNSGFETNGGSLDDWQVKRLTKDKVKCNQDGKPPVAYEGNCAFRFKGGVGENSQLMQKPELAGLTFAAGEVFTLQAQIYARGSIAFKGLASLKYGDGTQGKIKFEFTPADASDGYGLHSGDYALTSADLVKIKVMFKNKSASGKIDVDDVRLTVAAVASGLLALP